jgi:hypothetical protein
VVAVFGLDFSTTLKLLKKDATKIPVSKGK